MAAVAAEEKKKEKKNPILFPLILWLCHRIISVVPYSWTEPLWLPPDCVLSVAAPLCFCRLFLCALNRCLWICGLIFLWWGFGSNGRRGTCNGGMDGVDLVPSPISTVCPLWSGYFEALSLWLMNDFLVPQKINKNETRNKWLPFCFYFLLWFWRKDWHYICIVARLF